MHYLCLSLVVVCLFITVEGKFKLKIKGDGMPFVMPHGGGGHEKKYEKKEEEHKQVVYYPVHVKHDYDSHKEHSHPHDMHIIPLYKGGSDDYGKSHYGGHDHSSHYGGHDHKSHYSGHDHKSHYGGHDSGDHSGHGSNLHNIYDIIDQSRYGRRGYGGDSGYGRPRRIYIHGFGGGWLY